jgi:hypothetical protein
MESDMTPKTATHRAWCNFCRAFTDHRKAGADPAAKLECVTCRGGEPA